MHPPPLGRFALSLPAACSKLLVSLRPLPEPGQLSLCVEFSVKFRALPAGQTLTLPRTLEESERAMPLRCAECQRAPRPDENADDRWRVYSDGLGELMTFCPECAQREFGAPLENVTVEGR